MPFSEKQVSANTGAGPDPAARRPFRLLYVTPRFPPQIGGVENHVYQVARRVARPGFDVTVLTTDQTGKLPPAERSDGFQIQRVRAFPKGGDYYFAPAMYKVITRGGWDLVHVQSYHTLVAPLAMLAAGRARIPYVLTFHGGGHSSRFRNALRSGQRFFLRPLFARATRLVAVAQFELDLFASSGLPREKFVLIPNGSDLPGAVSSDGTATDPNLIVSVGRLEKYKGHQRILTALPGILKNKPDAHLWIAGEGPYRAELEQLANKLGVAERVEIRALPASDREGMANRLARAALVVLLSEYETEPIAVLEALALGRPVLVADTSGLSELAAKGLARAIPLASTPDEVASAVLDLLSNPPSPQPIHLATWDECADNLAALYESIAGRTACAS